MNQRFGHGGGGLQAPRGGAERVIPFGKYLLLDRIAVGGMAEVYTAKSFGVEGFEKILAIKRILPTMAEDQDFIQMFIDEAKIAGQLTHANIAPIYELGKIGDSHYIAMEYVWGKDLLQIMNRFRKMRKQMPPSMGAWIGAKMCEGLDFAHRKKDRSGRPMGIIHRDVSPQNCLVSYEGQVKMIDFGIAKAASRNTKTQAGVLKGKFGYMSPEQVRGLPIDHRSDIFAVGTCLYEMLTTERLFVGESDFSTLEKVRNAQVAALSAQIPDVPRELEDIVMKALARDVESRWQSAAEMQEALQRFIARERPPFGTSKLAAWMRTAFAPEMAKEKQRIDSFAKIGPPAAPPPPPPPRSAPAEDDEPTELAGEATVMTASPFDEDAPQEEILEQATQIFFSAEEMMEEAASAPAMPSVAQVQARPVGLPPPQAAPMRPAPVVVVGQPSIPVGQPMPARPAPMPAPFAPQPAAPQAPPMMQGGFAPQPAAPQAPPMQAGFAPQPFAPQQPAAPQAPPMQAGFAPQPFAPQPLAPQPATPQAPPMQAGFTAPPAASRRTDTMELQAPAALARPSGSRKGALFALVAAAVVFLVVGGGGIAWLVMRGPGTGTIEVRVLPAEAASAAVALDGDPKGAAPLRIEGVSVGPHVLSFEAPGFQPLSRPVAVTENGTVSLDVALSPSVGVLVASSAPVQPVPTPSASPATATGAVLPTAPTEPAPSAPEPSTTPSAEPTAPEPTPTAAAPSEAPTAREPTPTGAAPAEAPPAPEPTPRPTAAASAEPATPPAGSPRTASAPSTPERRERSSSEPSRETRSSPSEPTPTRTTPTPATPTPTRTTPTPATPAPTRTTPTRQGSTSTPAPARGGQGILQIQTLPWARVFVDGRDTGRNTPVRDLRVSAGSHRIGLRTADGRMTEVTVEVPANETVRIVRQL